MEVDAGVMEDCHRICFTSPPQSVTPVKTRDLPRVSCLILATIACCSKSGSDKIVVASAPSPYRVFAYGRLCYALQELEFESMKERYSDEAFDVDELTLTTTSPHGTKRVVDHGEVGPIELWTHFTAIDIVRADIEWRK